MTEVSEAESLIRARMPRWAAEGLHPAAAVNRVLAESVRAERDQPPFDRVTMDGIAIRYSDWVTDTRTFEVVAMQAAGERAKPLTAPGQCIQIMTGAMCPDGADTIIPVERLQIDADRATVARDTVVEARQFIHYRASDRGRRDTVLAAGLRLGPAEIAVLASAGRAEVAVTKLPKVAVVSTGDELVAVDAPTIEPYQIRSCNDLAVAASLERSHLARVTRSMLKDDPDEILDSISSLHTDQDALILSGGVSMGEFDFVPAVLEKLGCELVFHRINQKPGRPMWFGISAEGKPIFALPGNPVSTLLCMTRFVVPAFREAAGLEPAPPEYARLTSAVKSPPKMTYFVPVKLAWAEDGTELAEPRPTNTSGDFVTLAATDGFCELPQGRANHPEGTVARLYRW